MSTLEVDKNNDGNLGSEDGNPGSKGVQFEAGKLKQLLFDENRQKKLFQMAVKHNNEWV